MNVKNEFMSTKSPFEFVFSCCELSKVIFSQKAGMQLFVLKLSGIHYILFLSQIWLGSGA